MIGSDFPRRPLDAYDTIDDRLVEQLARHFPLTGLRVWEPACGTGYLVHGLRRAGAVIVALGDNRWGDDFFALQPAPGAAIEAIITNPPFERLGDFVRHGLKVCPGWVVMLCRWDWLGGCGVRSGKHELVDLHPRFHAMTLPTFRPWWSYRRQSSPRHAFTWLVWRPAGHSQSVPIIWRN